MIKDGSNRYLGAGHLDPTRLLTVVVAPVPDFVRLALVRTLVLADARATVCLANVARLADAARSSEASLDKSMRLFSLH
jgi:hypothetical protein